MHFKYYQYSFRAGLILIGTVCVFLGMLVTIGGLKRDAIRAARQDAGRRLLLEMKGTWTEYEVNNGHICAIDLHNCTVSDEQLKCLFSNTGYFGHVSELDLSGTGLTDAGLAHLESLTGLRALKVENTKVTKKGLARLKIRLPDCRIQWQGEERRAGMEEFSADVD